MTKLIGQYLPTKSGIPLVIAVSAIMSRTDECSLNKRLSIRSQYDQSEKKELRKLQQKPILPITGKFCRMKKE